MFLYKKVLKTILFKIDAETVHNRFSTLGEFLGAHDVTYNLTSSFLNYKNETLNQRIFGVDFANPIGLAGGFDYDGHMTEIMSAVGFGANTVGTVTAKYYEGNTKPRMGRLPKSRSLLVNKGFKSGGADAVLQRLDKMNLMRGTVGISVGSSNLPEINSVESAIEDYVYTFKVFKDRPYVKYFELNISCPNITFQDSFISVEPFKKLVDMVVVLNIKQPIFVKMPNEKPFEDVSPLMDYAITRGIKGFNFSNLVKDRGNQFIDPDEIKAIEGKKGNFSGKPTERNANALVRAAYKKYQKEIVIVGCGGVFNAEDAYEKIKNGASLVQMITGMVYEGPAVVGSINKGVARLLKKDGFDNISQAIGSGVK